MGLFKDIVNKLDIEIKSSLPEFIVEYSCQNILLNILTGKTMPIITNIKTIKTEKTEKDIRDIISNIPISDFINTCIYNKDLYMYIVRYAKYKTNNEHITMFQKDDGIDSFHLLCLSLYSNKHVGF